MEKNENDVIEVEQHDKSKKTMEEDANVDHMEIETVAGPSSNEGGMVKLQSSSFRFPRSRGKELQKSWAKVKLDLESYGISCTLNLDKGSMTVSTTKTTRKQKVYIFACISILLFSSGVPADKALRTMRLYPVIMVLGHRNGLCSTFGIKEEQYIKRRKLLLGSTLKELSQLTGCELFLCGDFFIVATGSIEGVALAKKIVTDCIVRGVRPAAQFRKIKRMNGVIDGLGALRF